jgi:hypothetical protein
MIRFLREVVADLGYDAPVLERTVSPGDVDLYSSDVRMPFAGMLCGSGCGSVTVNPGSGRSSP